MPHVGLSVFHVALEVGGTSPAQTLVRQIRNTDGCRERLQDTLEVISEPPGGTTISREQKSAWGAGDPPIHGVLLPDRP